jgi:hypothetical protein
LGLDIGRQDYDPGRLTPCRRRATPPIDDSNHPQESADRLDLVAIDGGSGPARFWSLTWLQARERMIAAGVPATTIDRGLGRLDDPRQWLYGPAMIIAWGHRPAP